MKTIDPLYIVPSHTILSSQVIPDLYEKTRKAIEEKLCKYKYTHTYESISNYI